MDNLSSWAKITSDIAVWYN